MYRVTNRSSFLGKPGCSCLAQVYCKLVAIELAIKDHLGAPQTATMQHDLQSLLIAFANSFVAPPQNISSVVLMSMANQLANTLGQLSCTSKQGTRTPVPAINYPYMRYVLHEQDGFDPLDSKEADLQQINAIADNLIAVLSTTYAVTP